MSDSDAEATCSFAQPETPSTAGTQFNIHRGAITWLNDVTDAEYNGPVAPRK